MKIGRRINVIGSSASGKSTIAQLIAKKLELPYLEMDKLFWEPNWKEPKDEVFFSRLSKAIEGSEWVLDGNYNRTLNIKWQRVEAIVWIDYSFFRTFLQAFQRAFIRALHKKELWEGTGNKESFRKSFFSKNSIILYSIKNYKKMRNRYLELKRDKKYEHIRFIQLRNPKEVNKFIQSLEPIK
ncbi:MAG: adenylate kinase [Oligoflexia bacterium]|nr:adenylate kinase [Oligoflexia bacterium]